LTGDVRQSDFRMTAQIAAHTPITAGDMAVGDFSASLEMTGRGGLGCRLSAIGYRLTASGVPSAIPPRHCVALSPLTSSGAQESI